MQAHNYTTIEKGHWPDQRLADIWLILHALSLGIDHAPQRHRGGGQWKPTGAQWTPTL